MTPQQGREALRTLVDLFGGRGMMQPQLWKALERVEDALQALEERERFSQGDQSNLPMGRREADNQAQ